MKTRYLLGICLSIFGLVTSFVGGSLFWMSRTDSHWTYLVFGALALCFGIFFFVRGIFRLVPDEKSATWKASKYYRYGTLVVFFAVFGFGFISQVQKKSEQSSVEQITENYFSLRDDFWFELKTIAQSQNETKFDEFIENAQIQYRPMFEEALAELTASKFIEKEHQEFQQLLASDVYYHLTVLEQMEEGTLTMYSPADEWRDIGLAVDKSYGQMLPYIKEKGFRKPASIR